MRRSAILMEKRLLTFFFRQLRYEWLQQFRYIHLRVHGIIKENGVYNHTYRHFVVNLSFRIMDYLYSK